MKLYNVLVVPDLQVPYQDTRSLAAVEKVMKDYQWDEIIQLGDFMDFDCISTHNTGKLRSIEGKTIRKDYIEGNKILDRWQRLAPKAKIVILEGNHDERMLRYLDANPQLVGSLEVPIGLRLEERGIRWVPYWSLGEVYKVGNAYFAHGQYTNEFHSKKMVSRFGVNIFYGHLHDMQCYPLVLRGEDKTLVGQSMGCLCRYDQAFLKGVPTNWQQGFGTFHFKPNGYFTYYITRIFNHEFVYNWKEYKG